MTTSTPTPHWNPSYALHPEDVEAPAPRPILKTMPTATNASHALGGDHSTGGVVIGGSLKRAGLGFGLVRYACAGRGNVNITPKEIADLKANGIPVGIVVEFAADWLLGGYQVGYNQAKNTQDITRACGLPDGVQYFAADFDCTLGGPTSPGSPGDRNMQQILATLEGAAHAIGAQNVGFYGSYYAMDWLIVHAPWIGYYWQTAAWSHGNFHVRRVLYQRAASMNVAGVQVDIDDIVAAQWGQRVASPPPPPPPPPAKAFNEAFNVAYNLSWEARRTHPVSARDAWVGGIRAGAGAGWKP